MCVSCGMGDMERCIVSVCVLGVFVSGVCMCERACVCLLCCLYIICM